MLEVVNKEDRVFTIQVNDKDSAGAVIPIAFQKATLSNDTKIAQVEAVYIQNPSAYMANRTAVRAQLDAFTEKVYAEEAKLYV